MTHQVAMSSAQSAHTYGRDSQQLDVLRDVLIPQLGEVVDPVHVAPEP